MNDAFVLRGRVELDTSDFDSKADDVQRRAREVSQDTETTGNRLSDFWRDTFSVTSGSLLSDALRETWEFTKQFVSESITLASDLQEIQNVVDVTFGDGAATINSWAKASLSAYGMSELKAKKYVSTMGAMLKSMGMTDEAVQEMSVDIVSLGADMASFYNMDHEEIMTKIRAGFAGEIEPLRQLGINMSVANLEAFALSRGMDKTYKSMTQAEQATLRFQYLMDATADAQGDFTRTADSYANSIKRIGGAFDQIKTDIGQGIIDMITPALDSIADLLTGDSFEQSLTQIGESANSAIAEADQTYSQAKYLIDQIASMEGTAAENSDEWNSALKALVKTMPELGKYIDTTTGQIMVNTEELWEHAKAINNLAVYDAKEVAVSNYEQLYKDSVDDLHDIEAQIWGAKAVADDWLNRRNTAVNEVVNATGLSFDDVLWAGANGPGWSWWNDALAAGADKEKLKYIYDASGSYMAAQDEVDRLEDLYEEQTKNVEEAERTYNVAKTAADNYLNSVDPFVLEQAEYNKALAETEAAFAAVEAQGQELIAAYNELKSAARDSLEGVVGGWKNMDEAMNTRTKLSGKDGLIANIESEAEYMENYSKNLQTAMTMGLDPDFIAKLSDGSEQSYSILSSLMTASDEEIKELMESWAAYETSLEDASTSMATAHAEVDTEIQAMKEEYLDLVAEFDQSEAARANQAETVKGLKKGWDENIDSLKTSVSEFVDWMTAELGHTYSLKVGGITYTGGETTASNAKGLDYVPYNNYLSYLHKGEAVLSAVEAERYRSGMMSPAAIDYDRLASSIADSLSGALVQMDGRTVGELVAPAVSRAIQYEAQARRYG